jgi:hypothetical protein
MKAALCRVKKKLFWIDGNKQRHEGPNPELRGDCSELRGNLDDCELTNDDRATGVQIETLVIE